MTLLDAVTSTLIGARCGLGLLSLLALIACAHTEQPTSAIGRAMRTLFVLLSIAILVFQVPRLAWILAAPRETTSRLIDLGAVLLISAVMVGAIAVAAVLRGIGAERVKRGVAVNLLCFAAMIAVGWCFR